mmetsp:Transcript_10739/g.21125  ORF Transcript_10739/g.21125 Transcript_10739/m.21125 type:complete len:317 (+) Transcript_10739:304-1254(+)
MQCIPMPSFQQATCISQACPKACLHSLCPSLIAVPLMDNLFLWATKLPPWECSRWKTFTILTSVGSIPQAQNTEVSPGIVVIASGLHELGLTAVLSTWDVFDLKKWLHSLWILEPSNILAKVAKNSTFPIPRSVSVSRKSSQRLVNSDCALLKTWLKKVAAITLVSPAKDPMMVVLRPKEVKKQVRPTLPPQKLATSTVPATPLSITPRGTLTTLAAPMITLPVIQSVKAMTWSLTPSDPRFRHLPGTSLSLQEAVIVVRTVVAVTNALMNSFQRAQIGRRRNAPCLHLLPHHRFPCLSTRGASQIRLATVPVPLS